MCLKFQLKTPHRSFITACQISPYLGVSKNTQFKGTHTKHFCVCPFKCKWAAAPSPLFRRGQSFNSSRFSYSITTKLENLTQPKCSWMRRSTLLAQTRVGHWFNSSTSMCRHVNLLCKSSIDCCGSLRAVSMLIEQIITSHGRGFPLLLHNLESVHLDRLFMIYGNYKKGVGGFSPL